MDLQATPAFIPTPRSAQQLFARLEAALGSRGADPLLSALTHIAARYGEILVGCVNAAPELHIRAFTEFLAAAARPAAAAQVHLSFSAAPGKAAVVVPKLSRVAATPRAGDSEAVVFETCEDLELVRANGACAFFVDAGHGRVADVSALYAPQGRADLEPMALAVPVAYAWHIGHASAFGLSGLRELRLQVVVQPSADTGAGAWLVEWGVVTPTGFLPCAPLSDGTAQLSRSGEIVFAPPADWPLTRVGEIESRWLTARLRPPAIEAGATMPPPAARPPRVLGPSLRVLATTAPQAPLAACSGPMPLDISKDFHPFGERPRFGDVVQLLSPAFAQAGARIDIAIQMTNPQGARTPPLPAVSREGRPLLAWEISSLAGWTRLDAIDGTQSFTGDASVAFTIPADVAPVTLAGKTGVWVRARLAGGHYGATAASDGSTLMIPNAPAIHAIALRSTIDRWPLTPEWQCSEGALMRQTLAAPVRAFDVVPTADVEGPALYLGLGTAGDIAAVLKAGQVLNLQIVPPPARPPISCSDAPVSAPGPRWQMRASGGWRDLDVRDGTLGLTRSGLVRLTTRAEAATWAGSSIEAAAGSPLAWLRVVWPAGTDTARVVPLGLALNAVPARHTQLLRDEVLGSGTGQPGQTFSALRKPVIGTVRLQVLDADERWQDWMEADDFDTSSGDAEVFTLERQSGEIRFGDGRNGRALPRGINNVRLQSYAFGGGSAGNRSALTITQLRSAIPAVQAVTNIEASWGGMDVQDESDRRRNASALLRHRGRAVCADDYADIARQASPEVARAYCVAGRDLAARVDLPLLAPLPPPAAREPGVLTVVVLPQSDAAQPQPSLELLRQVQDFLDARRAPAGRMVLVGPSYAPMAVKVRVRVATEYSAQIVSQACVQQLEKFLHPLHGGDSGKGWAPGQRPHQSDLIARLAAIDGVQVVLSVKLSVAPANGVPTIICAGEFDVRGEAP